VLTSPLISPRKKPHTGVRKPCRSARAPSFFLAASIGCAALILWLSFSPGGHHLQAERDAEETICREIAADAVNGAETLAAYMATRCPARFLTEVAPPSSQTIP
jgi:hypothetical protein